MAVATNEYVTLEHTFDVSGDATIMSWGEYHFKHTFENEYTIYVHAKKGGYGASGKLIVTRVRIDSPGIFLSGHGGAKSGSTPANVTIQLPEIIQISDNGEFNIKIENIVKSGKCLVFDNITINEYKVVTEKRPDGYCVIANLVGERAIHVTKMAGGRRKKGNKRTKNARKHRKSTRRR